MADFIVDESKFLLMMKRNILYLKTVLLYPAELL